MKEVRIDRLTEGQRIDKFLKRYLPNAGAGFLYRMLRQKKIVLNGAKSSGSDILKEGDLITIYFSDETLEKFRLNKEEELYTGAFERRIIYEDSGILIYNKPAGMLTQKAEKGDVSLDDLLVSYLMKKNEADPGFYRPSAVNRLDRNTSGLLICAKNLKSARTVSELIRKRMIKKEYICLVKGRFENEGLFESVSGRDGSAMATRFTLVEGGAGLSYVNAELVTGRTHQIRQQLAEMGHPIAGDPKYGDRELNRELREKYGLKRQYLHSFRLSFPDIVPGAEELNGKVFEESGSEDLPEIRINGF